MCNHQYRKNYQLIGKRCQIGEKLASGQAKSTFYFDLPIDDTSICLFHSTRETWKAENGISTLFVKLLKFLEETNQHVSLSEFCIGADSGLKQIELVDITCHFSLDLSYSNFYDKVLIKNLQVPNAGLYLNNCIFQKQVRFISVSVSSISLMSASLQDFTLSKLSVLMQEAHFQNIVSEGEFILSESSFSNGMNFKGAIFAREQPMSIGEEASVYFLEVESAGATVFSNANFVGGVEFRKCDFPSAQFVETTFSKTQPTYFSTLRVPSNGQWIFQGKSTESKMFENEVGFQFNPDDILGTINFENVNFGFLYPSHKDQLVALEKTGRVRIGKGCIKYRHQTAIKRITTSEINISLFEELARTFSGYYIAHNGINLGVEVVERTTSELHFFYFSDEDISREDFLGRFEQTNKGFWGSHNVQNSDQLEPMNAQNHLQMDSRVNQLATFLKLVLRGGANELTEHDWEQVAMTTSPDGQPSIHPQAILNAAKEHVTLVIKSLNITVGKIEAVNSAVVIGNHNSNITQDIN